jgi:ribosomal peptide maturation radical SAM protein 1
MRSEDNMVATLENLFGTDPRTLEELLKDPVAFLAREGIGISQHNVARLRKQAAKLQRVLPAVPAGLSRENLPGSTRRIIRDLHEMTSAVFDCIRSNADVLLVVPAFAGLYRPALGAHLLQACAREAGFQVGVLYANLLFASVSGEHLYNAITEASCSWLMGERIFSRAAFNTPPLGFHRSLHEELEQLELQTLCFCNSVAADIARMRYAVVGASTTFEQTNASIALLNAIKSLNPATITVIGGSNCDGEMAEGIASLSPRIDYVFSGECEVAFPEFLRQTLSKGLAPGERIIRGLPAFDLDALPEPDFSEYFAQLEIVIPSWKERPIWLPFETSRGCWWGVKQHCTFCGFNGETIAFRQKSPSRIIGSLNSLLQTYPVTQVNMTDNIMPHSFFQTLLPRLATEIPPAHIFYEQKANITLDKMRLLEQAGVRTIQPGIEAISSSMLRRMKKGVLARQNIALLRYARSLGVATEWNMLVDLPGDERADYEQTLKLIPLLRHLHPPSGEGPVLLDRFSPYFNAPDSYGISNVRPLESYALAFPESAPLEKLAYHFKGDYQNAYREFPELAPRLRSEIAAWRGAWRDPTTPPPLLDLTPLNESNYLLLDTRGLPWPMMRLLTKDQAYAALTGAPLKNQMLSQWAVEAGLALELDGWSVPLATADYDTLKHIETAV